MREHRFKTYDTKVKSFVCVDDYISDYRGSINDFFYNALRVDGLVLLEDIGIKDRNGKSIYNGDICSINGTVGKIEYIDAMYCLNIGTSKSIPIGLYESTMRDIEIIGNIHENQNLLKG